VKHGHRVQGKLRANASEGIVGAAATLKEPVVVPDVIVDPRYLMVNPETRSELAIPMIHKGKVIGVLDFGKPATELFHRRSRADAFDPGCEPSCFSGKCAPLRTIGEGRSAAGAGFAGSEENSGRAAAAGSDGRLRFEMAARYLLQGKCAAISMSFLRYGPQQLGIALGDVSGKGTAAALYGAVAIGIMRSLAPQKLQTCGNAEANEPTGG